MNAVNLIPPEQRGGGPGVFSETSPVTLVFLGGLAVALVAVIAVVMLGNQANERRAELEQVRAQTQTFEDRAGSLKVYADVAAVRERSLATIRTLAGGRFRWSAMLDDLARRLPADVKLTAIDGTLDGSGAPAKQAPGADGGPATMTLIGCARSHRSVADVMERVRAVDGVLAVALGASTKASRDDKAEDCPYADIFDITAAIVAPPAADAAALEVEE